MVNQLDWFVNAGAVAHFGLPLRSDEDTSSVLPALPGVLVDVQDKDLDANSDLDFSDIPPSSVIYIRFNLRGDFSFIPEMGDNFSIHHLFHAVDIIGLVLRGLSSLNQNCNLLLCVGVLHFEAPEPAACHSGLIIRLLYILQI